MELFDVRLMAFAVFVMLSGCATFNFTKPAPHESGAVAVVYSDEGPSSWTDLPIKAYRVPQSQVIVSGYKRVVLPLGFNGASIARAATESNVSGVLNELQIDITNDAQRISDSLIDSGQYGNSFVRNSAKEAPELSVNPYIVISYVSETDVRPYVVLKATLRGSGNKTVWATRYIASVGKARPLVGEDSLTANDAYALKTAISNALEMDIKSMLADIASPRIRDDHDLIYVETSVPFSEQRVGFVGYKIGEDQQSLIFAAKIDDGATFAGVHVLDKSVTTYRPATSDDKFKFLEDSK